MADTTLADRAVSLLRDLEAHYTDAPEVPRWYERLLARAIDTGVAIVAVMAIAAVAGLILLTVFPPDEDEGFRPPTGGEAVFLAAVLVAWVAAVLWLELFPGRGGRQTIGHRLCGIHIVRASDGSAPSRILLTTRWLTMVALTAVAFGAGIGLALILPVWASTITGYALLTLVTVTLVGRDGRGLHDRLWGTRLVKPRL